MIFSKTKDDNNRKNFNKYEYKQLINKYIKINLLNKQKEKINKKRIVLTILYKKSFTKNKSKTKIITRCILTYKQKNIYKPFQISRSQFKEFLSFGIIPGSKKAIW